MVDGIEYGKNYLIKQLKTNKYKYCLKLDIKHFYPSINKEILKHKLRAVIKDIKVLNLLDNIIDSTESGIPIGNYTSQWFGNFYLQDTDHYIKEQLKIKCYVRYMDDMVLLGESKEELHQDLRLLEQFLETQDLKIKGNWSIFKINSRPIDFLGCKFMNNKTYLRGRIYRRLRRILLRIQHNKYITIKQARRLICYNGWVKNSNCNLKYNKQYKNLVYISKLMVSKNISLVHNLPK